MIPKPRITEWAARKAAQFAVLHMDEMHGLSTQEKVDRIAGEHERISQDARDLGTAVHGVIDKYQKGEPAGNPGGTSTYLDRFIDWVMTEQPRFIENECTLWNRTHNYAGTADAIAEIKGKVYLLDWKCGKGVYAEAALQLAALAGCEFLIRQDGSEESIPALEVLAVAHIRPRSLKLIPVSGRQAENFAAFLNARGVLHWVEEVSPYVLGS